MRHGITAGVPAQAFHDPESLAHAGAQVRRAGDQVALVNVVRLHAAQKQFLDERRHHGHVVVDVPEQHRLVAQRDAGVRQKTQRVARFGGQFARVVGVDADEQGMELLQRRAELGRDSLRQKDRDARADAEKLHMPDRAQPAQQVLQLFVAEQQRVPAAEQHVAHFRVLADVLYLAIELRVKIVARRIAHESRPGAITAVCRAAVGDEEEHPVRIAMHQSGHRRMRIFAARIAHFPWRVVCFFDPRNDLPADGAVFIRRINQVEKARRDGQGQFRVGQFGAGIFLRRERWHQPLELFERSDAVFELPAPVVPVSV